VLVVDGTAALYLANGHARRLLFRGDALRVERGILAATAAAETRRLHGAIARVAAPARGVAPVEECLSLASPAASFRVRLRVGDSDDDGEPGLRRVWILIEDEDPQLAATLRLMKELTPRERDVLRHLAIGEGAKEIAWNLGLSTHTVAGYVKALHRRLGARSRGELLSRFICPAVTAALGADLAQAGAAAAAPTAAPSH
jgi:DNA-binding CsgD family transcriptional regulator